MNKNILKYIGQTSLRMIYLLFAISIVTFMLVVSSPIDPVDAYVGSESGLSEGQRENIVEYWGLDKSPIERYLIWGQNVLKGDMGNSITYRLPVSQVIFERVSASLLLMGTAWVLSGVLGFALGIVAGANKGKVVDKVIKTFCLLLSSTPTFWFGLIMLMVFAIQLSWFPIALATPIGSLADSVTWLDRLRHLILPALTLSITGVSGIALHTRQKLIDVLESEYVLFAHARGEKKWTIIKRHGIRNIFVPAITLQFASFSELFGGSVLAESVFSYPGLGNAASLAGLKGDASLLIGIAVFSAIFVFMGNFLADIIYGLVDPQMREAKIHG